MEQQVDILAAVRKPLFILKCIGLFRWTEPIRENNKTTAYASLLSRPLWLQRLQRTYRLLLQVPLTFTLITLMWTETLLAQSIEQAGNVLYMSFAEMGLVVKILHIWWMDAHVWQFIHDLEHVPGLSISDAQASALWQQEHRKFSRIAFLHIGGSLAFGICACLASILFTQHQLPFGYYVPLDMSVERNFWIAFTYDYFAIMLTALSNSSLDIFYCYCLFHMSLLYRLIGMRLATLQDANEAEALKEMRQIFQLQQNVNRLTLQCETVVSIPIMGQILLSALIICFCAYRMQSTSVAADPSRFLLMLQFVGLMVLQIFMPCYFGNEITLHSDALTVNIYKSNWLRFSPKTRKILFLYMEFLKRPVRIRAGGFFQIGLPIFSKTINNAYSLLAVILNMEK